ncbi:uncharacterized protein LOC112873290 [Panicum hallii]|uniref:uncharacterized protein LOC112873290 n=1 Tax=Panicum hallii TaxID=206008 RepID=UPI000DF4E5A3|nr:uncharacterized protein LOC112873290 [Panicum hallii]
MAEASYRRMCSPAAAASKQGEEAGQGFDLFANQGLRLRRPLSSAAARRAARNRRAPATRGGRQDLGTRHLDGRIRRHPGSQSPLPTAPQPVTRPRHLDGQIRPSLDPDPDPDRCLRGVGLRRRPPFPSPAPLDPQPGSSTRQPPPCSAPAQCGLRGRRLHPPPCVAGAQATACRQALACCGAARRIPPDSGHCSRRAAGYSPQPGRGQRALTPQPTARLAESPTPTATSCSRCTAGGRGTPQPTPPIRMDPPLHLVHIKILAADLLSLTVQQTSPPSFLRRGRTVARAELVGIVVSRDRREKFLRFLIDDGTGCVPCILWLNHQYLNANASSGPSDSDPTAEMALNMSEEVRLGTLVRVRGKIAIYRGAIQIAVRDVVLEKDPNAEISHHNLHWIQFPFLDCVQKEVLSFPVWKPPGPNDLFDICFFDKNCCFLSAIYCFSLEFIALSLVTQ